MKKNMTAKLLSIVLVAMAAFSLTGCTVTKTSTVTETHTDANGNTQSTTTTTTETNGKKTTETTTTEDSAEVEAEEIEAVEEVEEVQEEEVEYITATLSIDNESGVDIYAMYFALDESDDWGDEILRDNAPLADGEIITFHNALTYSEDSLIWDLWAADSDGANVEFDGLNMLQADDPENINILLEYDAESDAYIATVE